MLGEASSGAREVVFVTGDNSPPKRVYFKRTVFVSGLKVNCKVFKAMTP